MKITDYIKEQLYLNQSDFQWKIIQNSKKHVLELYITFRVDVDQPVHIEDQFGAKNHPDYIQFEDAIVFYDPKQSVTTTQHYLHAIPVSISEGVEKGLVDACLKQLTLTINAGRNQLREFLSDPPAMHFELKWNEVNFLESIRLLKETGRYDEEKLELDLTDEPSLMEELKGNAYDGVERV